MRVPGKPVVLTLLGAIYAVLLGASWYTTGLTIPDSIPVGKLVDPDMPLALRRTFALPVFDADGTVDPDRRAVVALERWDPNAVRGLPVVLLHGAPGSGSNFDALGPRLADGRVVIAPDLPGFGRSSKRLPDLGSGADARYMLALMDQLGFGRAHIVGWSEGGAVALHMADIAPDRVASITMLASVGLQSTEGSGSYYFEHAKYALGLVAFGAVDLIPHFGLLGERAERLGWLWNFWDTDQRTLRPIMERLRVPTLILHGRHDFLVHDWAAERHHELIRTSRLVMLDSDHFMPFAEPSLVASYLEPFFDRHDTPGVEPLTDELDLAPRPVRTGWRGPLEHSLDAYRSWYWVLQLVPVAVLAFWRRDLATAAVGWVVAAGWLDFGVATIGLYLGTGVRARRSLTLARVLALFVTTFLSLALTRLFGSRLVSFAAEHTGLVGFIAAIVVVAIALFVLRHLFTRRRRQMMLARLGRTHHEYWATWLLYAPLVPWWVYLSLRSRGTMTFSCCNPGIPNGGGIVGEPKTEIMRALGDDPRILLQRPLPDAEPAERLERLRTLRGEHPELAYPVVLKPEAAQRGFGMALARDDASARAAFGRSPFDLVAQQYHPGPVEVGVLWVRHPGGPRDGRTGRVFSVTRKVFPVITGDGVRTIEALIWAHPRFRRQATVFLDRFAERLGEVPGDGERLVLSNAGNHAQGCEFRDGADLITPELETAVDELASGYRSAEGGELDFGRFDLRARSEADVRAGHIAVVELNGTTAESTNLYDPSRSVLWAWGVLYRQWGELYRLGVLRRAQGVEPIRWRTLVGALVRNKLDASSRSVAR